MNHSALKSFAQETRRELQKQVGLRLSYWIGAEGAKSPVDSAEHRQFAVQIRELEAARNREGREALIERVAYLWFNRLAALRFMDANGYHPFGAKVIMPATGNETLPEILQQARAGVLDSGVRGCLANAKAFDDILDGRIPVASQEQAVYRLVLVAVCNYYQRLMPFLFEKIGDATELLLPEDLLTEHSVAHAFRTDLTDEDCRDVEVIGWLYQFYISEKKDAVMARDTAVPKEDIPAVTQLFTPHWIVRYLVENSLGRLWLQNRPQSRLRERMPYYIEPASPKASQAEPLAAEGDFLKIGKPEEIKLIDPACGSGHMLTYAYDLLYAIYAEEGYDASEIPGLILKHNLYGVEICDRAAALATFALCMKARNSDSRFFRRALQPNVVSLQDVGIEDGELKDYIQALGLVDLFSEPVRKLLHQFEDAKNFGSLIVPCLDAQAIADLRRAIEAKDLGGQLFLRETHAKVLRVLEQAECLCQRYHVAVANPPYMGVGAMNAELKGFVAQNFPEGKADLYGAFLIRELRSLVDGGALGMITIPNWLFLECFVDLRRFVLRNGYLSSLVHNGRGVWGGDFGSCAFTILNAAHAGRKGAFKRLFRKQGEIQSNDKIEANFHDTTAYPNHAACSADFELIPGLIIAYWTSSALRAVFAHSCPIGKLIPIKSGMSTTDNERFLRRWTEVSVGATEFDAVSQDAATKSGKKWFPFKKGGDFRKWYGNDEYVLNWGNNGEEIKAAVVNNPTDPRTTHWSRRIFGTEFFFLPSITWSKISASYFSVRASGRGAIFSDASNGAFPGSDLPFFVSLLNSTLVGAFLKILSPTINSKAGDIARIPLLDNLSTSTREQTGLLGNECIALARADWDNFETSWNFRDLPLLRPGQGTLSGGQATGLWKGATLEESWSNWKAYCDAAVRRMQELETENNRLFIKAYGLQDELKPDVPEEQITLARADARKDMAAFVSYAVGCMFGRYSLDAPGLILADAGATVADYLAKVPKPTFAPDEDGILPVLDGDWFPDDIVGRFREFLKVTFGAEGFDANLAFVEGALGRDLRKYFVRDFYKNHLSNERAYGYKKRPIYWMFSSPEGSFQALIYLHRYTRDTVNVLLNEYVREFIHKLEERHRQLTAVRLNESARAGDRTKAVKELGKIDKMLRELRAWERDVMLQLAQQRIEIDLDDGVKVNYLKLKGAMVPIPGLEKKEEE